MYSSNTIVLLDHMFTVEWTAKDGWLTPQIVPYQKLQLDPSACVLHYAFECFEGMKAYKDSKGQIRLFRPDKNMQRLNKSSARIALPSFDGEALTKMIGELVKLDSRFIPEYLNLLWLANSTANTVIVREATHYTCDPR